MSDLEKFLQGVPLNDRLERLKETGEDDEPMEEVTPDDGVINDDEREDIRRLLIEPGWAVLLKLLDNEITGLEDAARRRSLSDPQGLHGSLTVIWSEVAYLKKARNRIVDLAQSEAQKAAKENGLVQD